MPKQKILQILLSIFPVIAILGGAIGLIYLDSSGRPLLPISTSLETVKINVPLEKIPTGTDLFILETQNFLLFQQFESLPPLSHASLIQVLGISFWILTVLFVVLMTTFKRYPFIISAAALILLLTLSGVNGLNIGGIGTNMGLIICLLGLLLPASLIHVFFYQWNMTSRVLVIFLSGMATFILLITFSGINHPTLLFSENISIMALVVSAIFTVYIGHSFISNVYVLLARLNQGVGIKITWHLTVISLLYLLMIALMFLNITGGLNTSIPLPPFQYLYIILGILGYIETERKIKQLDQPYLVPWVGKIVYLGGFAVSILVLFKAGLSVNTPMLDFIEHFFIYSQLGFGFLFFLYLLINFSGVMNSGKPVEKIIYQPPFFPYFHMRLGALLTIVIFAVYADGIVAVQFGTASTNTSADFFYSTSRSAEATILYENSFERYRRNEKAMNAIAHLAFQQNQPTSAINTLTKSFNERPNVPDILLLSSSLQRRQRTTDAIFYLEQGLKYYPENPYLLNNLSLLYSKIDRPVEAFRLLEQMDFRREISKANQIGLQAMHQVFLEKDIDIDDNIPASINLSALDNLRGITSSHTLLKTDTIQAGTSPINRAILRNQWTNKSESKSIQEDLALLDSLLEDQQLLPIEEEELRETGVIRRFRDGKINETLKLLNGMAYRFQNSAGYYHAFAASVLTQQMDLENAAKEWLQAAEKGFSNFKSSHLPVIYFGGKEKEAAFISASTGTVFPDWMNFEGGELNDNDTVRFYQKLAGLLKMQGKEILPALSQIESPGLQAFFAKEVLIKKAHWLTQEEREKLLNLYSESFVNPEELAFLKKYEQVLSSEKETDVKPEALATTASFSEADNAYHTPWVLHALTQIPENVEKYNLLLEASQFNKDPLLWINLVKYSRMIGLDHYASSSLAMMSEWIDREDLIQLQIDHL